MRFSIKNRVESLIKRDRISAAIRKLQQFTKDKSDYHETYNTLNELKSKFTQIEKAFKAKTIDYATYDRERSKIRSSILDINNEIEELKETKDKKFIWMWIWAIITGLLIPVLGFLVPMWLDKAEECPVFEDKDCKLLVFNFSQSDDISPIAPSILEIFQTDEYYVDLMSAEMDPVIENATRNTVKRKVEQCDASFGIYGSGERINGEIYVTIKSYKEDTLLADMVDEVRDTLVSISETDNLVQQKDFRTMLNMMICLECYSCPVEEEELLAMIEEVNPEVRANHFAILAQIQYRRGNLIKAENTLTRMINSLMGGVKVYAYRGKVRDDQKKYEPAFQDYSYYLDEKPENHNVRLKRFTSAYNLLMTSPWQTRYAEYVDIAAEDLKLLKNNISEQEYKLAESRLKEMQKLKDKNMSVVDPVPPDPDPLPPVEQCDYVFQVKNIEGQFIKNALVSVVGHENVLTNDRGLVEFKGIPCSEFTDNRFTVAMTGYERYESQVKEGKINVVLKAIPDPDPMCAFGGEVLDEKGEPIFFATVTVEGLSPMRTDKDGRFKSRSEPCDIMEGRKFTIVANGYDPLEDVIRNMNMTYKMVPEKPEFCTFSGTIKNDKGITINGATISVYGINNVKSIYNGRFEVSKIPCDDFIGRKFNVYADGYETYSSYIRDDQSTITLETKVVMCTFSGSIFGQAGKAIRNATIDILGQPFITTNQNGYFKTAELNCDNLIGKSYSISAEGYQPVRGVIQENNLSVTHTLKRDAVNYQITGRIVNDLNDQSLQGAGVYINNDLEGRTGMKGEFNLDFTAGANETSATFRFTKSGFHSKSISVNLSRIGYQNIKLTPVTLRGKIVDNNNEPIAGATIRIKGLRNKTSDKNGDFNFSVPNGFSFPENVEVSKTGFQNTTTAINKIGKVVLTPNLTITGHILDTRVMTVLQQNLYVEATRPFNQGWAIGAEVYLDGKKIGTIQKDGRLPVNLTGKVNQSFKIRVVYKGLPGMTKTVKFTQNGQVVRFDLKPVG